jgi:hypothetical protein
MMASNIEQLIDHWISDPSFRANMRTNPEVALRANGIALTADEQAALQSIDWSLSDDQLMERISKQTKPGC